VTIQLRYLQTLIEVSNNQSSTIVFPLPIDVLQPLVGAAQSAAKVDGPERERLDEALKAARAALESAVSTPADQHSLPAGNRVAAPAEPSD